MIEDTVTEVISYSVSFVDLFSASRCRYIVILTYTHSLSHFFSHTNYSNYSRYETPHYLQLRCIDNIDTFILSLRPHFFYRYIPNYSALSFFLFHIHTTYIHIKIMYRIYHVIITK